MRSPFRSTHLVLSTLVLLAGLSSACAADRSAPPPRDPKPAEEKAASPAKAPAAAAEATPAASEADPNVVFETKDGRIVMDLFEDKAPKHAENFKKLVKDGWYDGSPFHRVIEGFMAQGGGKWGPDGRVTDVGYSQEKEIAGLHHHRGTLSQAAAQMDSGSQFYICFADTPWLDSGYTIFGEVVSGMEVVDKITKGTGPNGAVDPASATVITKAWLEPKAAAK